MEFHTILLFFSTTFFFLLSNSVAIDTISANQAFEDGKTIVSNDQMYELGFFSPGNSKNRYLGIWYKKISTGTVVWVANRDTPITDTSGTFIISRDGTLLIRSGGNNVIWSSTSRVSVTNNNINPMAQILDTGNLVVWDNNINSSNNNRTNSTKRNLIWQSFDYPGNTLLPGMKFGKDLVRGIEWNLTSWKSPEDPSPGLDLYWLDTNGYPQVLQSQGSVLKLRVAPWNGLKFRGLPMDNLNPVYSDEFVLNEKEIYYNFELNSLVVRRIVVMSNGYTVQLRWTEKIGDWTVYGITALDTCSQYGICGPYGRCSIKKYPPCSCMEGFEPKILEEWNAANWSSGCQRKKALDCGNGDGFRKIPGVKFPDTRRSLYNISMTLGECKMTCERNCSCTAYANLDIRNGGSGCLLWFDELIDMREYNEDEAFYIKMAASELAVLESGSNSDSNKKKHVIRVVVPTSVGLLLVGLILALYAWYKKRRSRNGKPVQALDEDYTNESQKEPAELPSFSLSKIANSTNNFSSNNKLGQGGFGPVYKGVLDGREIAVKRLSKTSSQGLDEFKNEVRCIAKLQHRNLVKLLGYCIQGDEIMLIYEYMPNKSLDSFIFVESKSSMLDWPLRFHIINGIARGLLYLHQDSRLRIIHRDLKAGNILLDLDMNPKISDFGLARRFRGHESEANTNKVVGTLGYISPEYAANGQFSIKSDVFSFGVLLLEIVSGKKNRGFSHQEHSDNLLGHAWRLYKADKSLELVSAPLCNSSVDSEVVRTILIGLLCVQHNPEDRPTMSSVVLMLGNEGVLPPPKQPAFFIEESFPQLNSSPSTVIPVSIDNVTITVLDAR